MDHSETEMPMPELLNSGAGIASVVIGLITLFLSAVVYAGLMSTFAYLFSGPPRMSSGQLAATQYFFLIMEVTIKSGASFVGIAAAIFGLSRSERRKDMAYVGLALNAILLLSAFVNIGTQYAMRVLRL